MRKYQSYNFLLKDIGIIFLSIAVAWLIIETEALKSLLNSAENLELLGAFIAGLFFTSVFTTAPAIVALGSIASSNSIFLTAIFGAFGSMIGDMIIFRFIRDRLSEHFLELVVHNSKWKRLKVLFKLKYFRWFTFLLGGLLIASPLPDELGIGLLGFSKMKMSHFLSISLVFNFIGILIIGLIAQTI